MILASFRETVRIRIEFRMIAERPWISFFKEESFVSVF